ncbi:hypothetical protein IV102_33405 [bacterium]|nr:hypothetical protein [bacterium]
MEMSLSDHETVKGQDLVSLRLNRKRSLRLWPSHWLTSLLAGLLVGTLRVRPEICVILGRALSL